MITATQEVSVTVTPRNRANFRRLKTNSIQSVKRWEKENELLYAMMEDESEWLAKLFPDVVISPEFFFYALEDGSLLCRLANYIQEKAELYSREQNVPVPGKKFRYHTMSKCGREIKLFRSRENVQQFLTWCRSHGIPEAILFESNDVVEVDDYREGCRGVIICLMEIVRKTSKFELDELPQLIQMEKEIEEDEALSDTELSNGQGQILDVEKINIDNLEVQQTDQPEIQSPSSLDSDSGVDSVFDQEEGENSASRLTEFSVEETEDIKKTTAVTRKQTPSKPKDQKSSPKSRPKTKELPSLLESTEPKSELDKQVCKIAQDYNIKIVHRLKEGKYIILGRIMFVRMLNDHMLVRIGGGWDTLEHYLMTHVPSKQALDSPSVPSSPAVASPRNSISAGSGSRNSLFEKFKRKEQTGIIRDSLVYSSQGSLSQLSVTQSTPKKKLSVAESDSKDITDAIRKIESSVSQNLATRPVSFTSKTFHQLKSRFDKGIFGTSRRTSSPDLTLKGKNISRRLSDTCTMADIATSIVFDGAANEDQKQASNANNNDSESRQTESRETEEAVVGKVSAPSEDLLGDETLQTPAASDEIDGSAPGGDLPSTDHANGSNWPEDLLGGAMNGTENYQAAPHGENLVDISSFDPFAAAPDQGELISIDGAPSETIDDQPKSMDVFEQIATESDETEVMSTPRIDLGDLLADSESAQAKTEETTVESSPPVILEDLQPEKESSNITETQAEGNLIESSPVTIEEHAIPEAELTKQAKPDEPVVNENVQDVPAIAVEPVLETESPKLEEETAIVEEPVPSEEAMVKSEGESTEAAPVLGENTTQEQSQQEVAVESIPVKVDEESKPEEEEAKPTEEKAKPVEDEAEPVEEVTKPSEEEAKPVEDDTKPSKEEAKPIEEVAKPLEDEAKPSEEVAQPVEEVAKPVEEEGKPVEDEVKPAEEVVKPVEEEAKPVEEEAKPAEEVVKPAEDEAKPVAKPAETEVKPSKAQAPKTEKLAEKVTKTKPQTAGARPKSPPKAALAAKQTAAKKPTGPARTTAPTKVPTTAATKKDVKAPANKTPATKPAAAAKVPATKTTASAAPGAKKPATKPAITKTEEAKKQEKPKSAATARPPTKTTGTSAPGAARPASAAPKKTPAATSKPAAGKVPGKDVKDAGPPKSAPKTTASRPASAKPTPSKTSAPATKPAAPKPSRTQSAKPSDKTDGAAKQPTSRPQSAKPKPTTTTTTVKKTTTTVTTRSGVAPVKTTTTKTVTQAKNGQAKTTTTTTKKETTRPVSAAKTTAGAKPTATGAKSAKPGGKPSTKAAAKKKVEEPGKGKEVIKQDDKPASQPENVDEPATATDEKPSEVAEIAPDEVPAEIVSEERPVETSPEEKLIELPSESAPAEQADEPGEVPPEGVEQSHVVTQIVTSKTTTVVVGGEEHSTTTSEETTFEQTVGES